MKLVRGIVREDKVNEIVQALDVAGAPGITVMNVSGRGAAGEVALWRGLPYPKLLPMSVVEVMAPDSAADDIARVIVDTAHTGHKGDGHVYVIQMDNAYAVRTRWREVA